MNARAACVGLRPFSHLYHSAKWIEFHIMVVFFYRWIRSGELVFGSIVAYVGSIFLLMAFCSPYWIESYEESFSNFKNMGLWEYCFKEFYYPYYQFPRKFNGCHNIFSQVSISLYSICYVSLFIMSEICHSRNTTSSVNISSPLGCSSFKRASL